MEPEESKESPLHCVSSTQDQNEATELQPLPAYLKTLWEEVYRSRSERLSYIAAKMRVPPSQIEDVLQEVWMDALRHQEGFQGKNGAQRLSSWLEIVVRNRSRDALRRIRRRREEPLDDLPAEETIDRKTKGPLKLMEEQEGEENVDARLEALRKEVPLNYHLMREHVLEGRPLQDLKAETGLSAHAVACRISRTMKKLRYRLRECRLAANAPAHPTPLDRRSENLVNP